MPKEPIVDPASIDTAQIIDDIEGIRKYNKQRHEMEQLTAIVRFAPDEGIVIGYKDITEDEFWVRGHIPGRPLMPGVIMIECSAQLCSYFYARLRRDEKFIGFGGVDKVRFRGVVEPEAKFIVVARALDIRSMMAVFDTQGFVNNRMVYEGRIIGVPL